MSGTRSRQPNQCGCSNSKPVDGSPLPGFVAGDHIDVTPAPGLLRGYSLIGAPEREPSSYRIAVALDPESRGGSRAVHESIHVGSRLVISEPVSDFRLTESAPRSVLTAEAPATPGIFAGNCMANSAGWPAAPLPLQLSVATEQGRLRTDDTVAQFGLASGASAGVMLMNWSAPPPAPTR
ncbi:hypothetical protein [Streptomyces sp. NPDC058086]|uniref:hypothetical protein n=1 Tax=Streptomyces sp. NPDC058086 TaxID=3346334 RepID=UPI0036E4C75A